MEVRSLFFEIRQWPMRTDSAVLQLSISILRDRETEKRLSKGAEVQIYIPRSVSYERWQIQRYDEVLFTLCPIGKGDISGDLKYLPRPVTAFASDMDSLSTNG